MRRSIPVLGSLLLLAACAPTATRPTAPSFDAAFSADGVAWVDGGRACVARFPSYRPVCPALPPVVAVGWNGGDAWAAVPGAGLLVTLDRAARTVAAGRVVALSGTRAYREDGSAVTYVGAATSGVPGTPSAVVTGGDGQDYALVAGTLRRVDDGTVLDGAPGPVLRITPAGAVSANTPGVVAGSGTYRLTGAALERVDAAGRVVSRVAHGPGRVGLVGAEVVTVSPGGTVRAFNVDLTPLSPRP